MQGLFDTLPQTTPEFLSWTWEQIEPFYAALETAPLTAATLDEWIAQWGRVGKHIDEAYWRLWADTTLHTLDDAVQAHFETFLRDVHGPAQIAETRLKRKLLASGLQPANFEAPLRNMQAEETIFREANLPLLIDEIQLGNAYDRVRSVQTVEWEGQETTLIQMAQVNFDPQRERREQAWRLSMARFLEDRAALNDLWTQLVDLRARIAAQADLPNYRAFRWQQMLRLDYTPDDCERFHDAVEQVVVPAARRALERRRQRLGIDSVRPWDVEIEPPVRSALRPFDSVAVLEQRIGAIFSQLDPQLGAYFQTMQRENLLDLENRKGKMPSSYCATYPNARRPFVFMNVVGTHEDVMTLLHECGHAFHSFEATHLPHHEQLRIGTEFHEVAATAMELLAAPYLGADCGGFYDPAELARAQAEHLDIMLRFWPYVAVVDAFQHWAHTHPQDARDPAQCDHRWSTLWGRFMQGEDWSGLDDAMMTGWHRKLHIFRSPFYYIDYGLAQLGAVQIWKRAQYDLPGAIQQYRAALALGGTRSLPDLFAAAGGRLAFDVTAFSEAVEMIESMLAELETQTG